MSRSFQWLVEKPISHRGFHDENTRNYENTMTAFQASIDAGFTIECDLHITSDRKVVVFHDPDLTRMTDQTGPVRNRTAKELAKIKIKDTDETIRTLDEHLELTSDKVPLLLELKGIAGEDNGLVTAVADCLRSYKGQAAVMSFNHWITAQFADALPDRPRGLTAMGDDAFYNFHMNALSNQDLKFISYRIRDIPCRLIAELKDQHNMPVITWTVRTKEDCDLTRTHADQITFEGFDPRETCI